MSYIELVVKKSPFLIIFFMPTFSTYLELTMFPSAKPIESIAVMPFVNESGNADVEYLSDGISEALINSLTELRQLKVIARSTAFRYKGKDVDPQQETLTAPSPAVAGQAPTAWSPRSTRQI